MATCLRVSDHSYNALEQAGCIILAYSWEVSSRLHSPFGSSSFCKRKSSAGGAGGFLGGREKLLMLQMSLEKEWKQNFNQSRSWAVWSLPLSTVSSCTPAAKWHICFGTMPWRKWEAGGEKHTAAHPHLKQQGRRVCSFSVFKTLDRSHSRLGKCKNEHLAGRTGCQDWQGWTLSLEEGDWAACQQN